MQVDMAARESLRLYHIAQSMTQMPQAILLMAIIGVACAEDHFSDT